MDECVILDDSLKEEFDENDQIVLNEGQKGEKLVKKHKTKKDRLKERNQKIISNSKQKKIDKKKKEEERSLKMKELNILLANINHDKLTDEQKILMKGTSEIGVHHTGRDKYREAVMLKEAGLKYDEEIIKKGEEKMEKSRLRSENKSLLNSVPKALEQEIDSPIIPSVTKVSPFTPESLEPAAKEERHRVYIPKPVVYIQLNRPADKQEERSRLPVVFKEQEIMELVNNEDPNTPYLRDVVVITGETGSGKTTQIPQFLYEAGYGTLRSKGKIAVTEPRRIAAINMSKRVAEEMGLRHGSEVGYQIRNDKLISDNSIIKFVTDGILLRELQNDLELKSYSVVVIDEAHERTVNTDVLIGMLILACKKRRRKYESGEDVEPLKLIIMSATLQVDDFVNNELLYKDFEGKKPAHIAIEGRTFPVDIRFASETPQTLLEIIEKIKVFVDQLHDFLPYGSILVFVPGKKDIIELINYFTSLKYQKVDTSITKDEQMNENDSPPDVEIDELMENQLPQEKLRKPMRVLPLYSMLDSEKQQEVFKKPESGIRTVIFSTNVAETSLTIPHVRYVVDCGLEKVRLYNTLSGSTDARIQYISKASAEQRAGRAGRTQSGICFRLFSSGVYQHRFIDESLPEIKRKSLDGVILTLISIGIPANKIDSFPLPTPIEAVKIVKARNVLQHIGALETTSPFLITRIGETLANLPLPPRVGKIIITGSRLGILDFSLITAACMSVREPFTKPPDIESKYGDVTNMVQCFCAWLYDDPKDRKETSIKLGLRQSAMEEILALCGQLINVLKEHEYLAQKLEDAIHNKGKILPNDFLSIQHRLAQAILSAYPDNVAYIENKSKLQYKRINDGAIIYLNGTSTLKDNPPKFICYEECIEDKENEDGPTRIRVKNPTKIDPTWLYYSGSKLLLTITKQDNIIYDSKLGEVLASSIGTYGNMPLPESLVPYDNPYPHLLAAILRGDVFQEMEELITYIDKHSIKELISNKIPQYQLKLKEAPLVLKKYNIKNKTLLVKKLREEPNFLTPSLSYWYPDEAQTKLANIFGSVVHKLSKDLSVEKC